MRHASGVRGDAVDYVANTFFRNCGDKSEEIVDRAHLFENQRENLKITMVNKAKKGA